MAERVLITGCNGLLGANLVFHAADHFDIVASSKSEPVTAKATKKVPIDITQRLLVDKAISAVNPSVIVHCAAETRVDYCEENPEIAQKINVEGTRNIAIAAQKCKAHMVYISSDSVFDGVTGQYREDDQTNPINVYSKTKLDGESIVKSICDDYIIARTNMFGWNMKNKKSLSEWIIESLRAEKKISGFSDVIFNPLLTNDLAKVIIKSIKERLTGTYHIGASESLSKYDFAIRLAQYFKLDETLVSKSRLQGSDLVAPRPLNTSMKVEKVEKSLKERMPTVVEGIEHFWFLNNSGYVTRLKGCLR